jgi:hypothetical protein
VVEYITSLDESGLTFIWAPHMSNNIAPRSAEDAHVVWRLGMPASSFLELIELVFKAISQGESSSSLLRAAVVDIILLHDDPELVNWLPRV